MEGDSAQAIGDLFSAGDRYLFLAVCQAILDIKQTADKPRWPGISKRVRKDKHLQIGTDPTGLSKKIGPLNEVVEQHFGEAAVEENRTTGWDLTPTGWCLWRQWARQRQEEEKLFAELIKEKKRKDGGKRPALVVSAGDTVRSYLLPRITEHLRRHGSDIEIEITDFLLADTFALTEAGVVDVVLAWDLTADTRDNLDVASLNGTGITPHALFRPGHALAARPSEDGRVPSVASETLRQYPVVYPDLPSIRDIASRLEKSAEHPVSKMSLPALGYYLVSTQAVGLVPGWTWLLRNLQRRFGLVSAELVSIEAAAPGANTDLNLVTRRGARTEPGPIKSFCDATLKVIERLAAEEWPRDGQELEARRLTGTWYLYYVTLGKDRSQPLPSWCVGALTWGEQSADPARRITRVAGKASLTSPFDPAKWALEIEAELINWSAAKSTLIIRTYLGSNSEPAVLTFSEQVRVPGVDGYCLAGINVFTAVTRKLTATPALLSEQPLGEAVLQQFIHQDLVSFLAPDLANDPVPTATFDSRLGN